MKEIFERLLERNDVVINRITSPRGFASEPFLQDEDEFVYLAQGSATMDIDGTTVEIRAGQHMLIPGKTPHRIVRTGDEDECVWIAVHLRMLG